MLRADQVDWDGQHEELGVYTVGTELGNREEIWISYIRIYNSDRKHL